MSSNYDELERLQRLRESGALSDEEFQAEKRRILGYDAVGPEQVSEAEAGLDEATPSRRPLYLIIGGAALLLAIVAGLLLGRMVDGGAGEGGEVAPVEDNVAAEANLIEAPLTPDVRTLPAGEQLARAFEAAFGSRGSAVLKLDSGKDYQTESFAEDVRYAPGRLIWLPFGPVLLSEGKVEDAAHVSAGKIAIHYLKPAADRFEVVRAFPSGVVTGSFGQVARWSVNPRFSDWPVIVAEGGGTWQGYTCSWLTLTELRPDGPAKIAEVPLTYDDAGAKGEEGATSIDGRILNIAKDQSFDIVYSGSRAFSEHYVRGPGGYAVAGGKSTMATC